MSSRHLGPRYVSNEDLARMKARYAHLEGDTSMPKKKDGPKRRQYDTSDITSLAADIDELASEALDLAEEARRREEQLKANQVRPDDARRALALNQRGGR